MIYPTDEVSEEVNRKCYPKNMMVQHSVSYADPECHSAQRRRWTDSQTTV